MGVRAEFSYKLKIIVGVILMFVVLLGGVIGLTALRSADYWAEQTEVFATTEEMVGNLYSDYEAQIPKIEISAQEVDEAREALGRVKASMYDEWRVEVSQRLDELAKFVEVRDGLAKYFDKDAMKSTTKLANVEEMEKRFAELKDGSKRACKGMMEALRWQYDAMELLKTRIRGMFTDDVMNELRVDLKRSEYDEIVALADGLKQRDVAEGFSDALKKADEVLKEREKAAAEALARALEARRRAEELRRQREKEVAAAWRTLNVPYWSQNHARIYNGCEAASLLMALQFKGYLQGMDLARYVEMMPKSSNPFEGFTHSIYDFEPRNVPHWIAPAPLAKFGQESSGGANVEDITGASLDDLDREIAAGNPVVIYVTWLFKPVTYWAEDAPKNLHVVLLTGYNEISGTQRLTDPWTQSDGSRYWDVPRSEIERIFDSTGRRAVVVR